MEPGAQLIASVISAVTSILLTGTVGAVAWYFRKYIVSEIEKNSKHRRRAEGEDPHEDKGKLDHLDDRLDEMEAHREEEHEEVRENLRYLAQYLRNLKTALRASGLTAEVEEPDHDGPGYLRGGSRGDSDD